MKSVPLNLKIVVVVISERTVEMLTNAQQLKMFARIANASILLDRTNV